MNINGEHIVNVPHKNNMIITNTLFNDKMALPNDQDSPRKNRHHDGTTRRNPFRNEIDYIIVNKTKHRFEILQRYSNAY